MSLMRDFKIKRLKKELKLLDVYAIATGTTLSAGFFLLPDLQQDKSENHFHLHIS